MKMTLFSTATLFSLLFSPLSFAQSQTAPAESMPAQTQNVPSPNLPFKGGVRAVLEDSRGRLWVGSHEEGVAVLENNRFRVFTTEDGLTDNQVRRIQEDRQGRIWFECGEGLSFFNGKTVQAFTEKDYSKKKTWSRGPDDLWFKADAAFGVNEKEGRPGTYRWDGKTLSYHVFPIPGFDWDWNPKEHDGGNQFSVVATPQEGKDGTLWFATYGAVIGFDGKDFTFIDDARLGLNDETGHLHIRAILVDSKGNLWIGNNGVGVFVFDGKTVTDFTEKHKLREQDTDGASLGQVFSLAEDRRGHIWFGTRHDGVWRYDGKEFVQYTAKDGLKSTQGWSVYTDRDGNLWVAGAAPGGLYKYTGTAFERVF